MIPPLPAQRLVAYYDHQRTVERRRRFITTPPSSMCIQVGAGRQLQVPRRRRKSSSERNMGLFVHNTHANRQLVTVGWCACVISSPSITLLPTMRQCQRLLIPNLVNLEHKKTWTQTHKHAATKLFVGECSETTNRPTPCRLAFLFNPG